MADPLSHKSNARHIHLSFSLSLVSIRLAVRARFYCYFKYSPPVNLQYRATVNWQ